eukprot:gene24674-10304_t
MGTGAEQGDEQGDQEEEEEEHFSEVFSFTMCNPPFFGSMSEASQNPNTACGGTKDEMVYPGGELAFVMRMVEDSVRLGGRVH